MSNDDISIETTRHIAYLARLALDESEVREYAGQLSAILKHAEDIASLDLGGVAPMRHTLSVVNIMRDDEVRPSLDREEVLSSAPDAQASMFLVPKIVGEE